MNSKTYNRFTAAGDRIACGSPEHLFMHEAAERARGILAEINAGSPSRARLAELFSLLTGSPVGKDFGLFPPFYTDYGQNIRVGDNVFINSGCCFQDQGGITLCDGCMIGHQVVIATLNHDLDPARRGDMFARPVVVGKGVWIGSHATILPGVTIGEGAVVAAGAVVARDVPARTVVAGVPAKVIKNI